MRTNLEPVIADLEQQRIRITEALDILKTLMNTSARRGRPHKVAQATTTKRKYTRRHKVSAAGRANIAAAQRARWAHQKEMEERTKPTARKFMVIARRRPLKRRAA